jgi:DNA-binding CsgD family transcriptional regulator
VLESLPPGPELAMAYCNLAQLEMESHEADAAFEWAQRALALARPGEHDEILIHALCTIGSVRLTGGDASGWADLERCLQLALAGGFKDAAARIYTMLCGMAVSRRQYVDAARWQAEGLAYCEARDLDAWFLYILAGHARMRLEQGDWNGAAEDAEAVLRRSPGVPRARAAVLEVLAQVRIRRGDPGVSALLDEVRALAGTQMDLQRAGRLAEVSAEAAWLAGDREAVRRHVQPAYDLVIRRHDPRMKGELASWLWRVDALEQAPTGIAEPYALEIAGDWRGAARVWKALGCPYEHANTLGWYGGESEQREALRALERLGAAPAAQSLRQRMRAEGVRGVPRGPRTSTRSNPHHLTKREAQILALLSEGLRNSTIARRLFVSTKTVEHHVSAILAKLGVTSRAEAAALGRRHPGHEG